jgi:hypothetical protein
MTQSKAKGKLQPNGKRLLQILVYLDVLSIYVKTNIQYYSLIVPVPNTAHEIILYGNFEIKLSFDVAAIY